MTDLNELLSTGLINQSYTGHRPELWEQQTSVTFEPAVPTKEVLHYRKLATQNKAAEQEQRRIQHEVSKQMKNQEPVFMIEPLLDDPYTLATRREILLKHLSTGVVTVDFVNADGAPSTMTCTTSEQFIPATKLPKKLVQETPKAEDPMLIKVFAIDRQGWRSFRLERMTQLRVHGGTYI